MSQTRTPAGLAGTVDHADAGNGWLVVRLMTRQAMDREGAHMGHCLSGSYHGSPFQRGYGYLAGEEEMTGDAIWSLRDPAGMSRATLDVRSCRVVMAKGKGNSDVGGKAARRLKALVAAFRAAGADLDFAGETGLVVAPNGYVCREDQAPPEVMEAVRARHRAAVEAGRERALASRRGLLTLGVDSQSGDRMAGVYGIPWTEEPLTDERVTVDEWCERELRIEAPTGSWIGRLRANRAAGGPQIPPRTFAFSQRVQAARLPFFAAVCASLMEEELRSLMDGSAAEADPHVALRRHIEAAGDEAA